MRYDTEVFGVDGNRYWSIVEKEDGEYETFEAAQDHVVAIYTEIIEDYQNELNSLKEHSSFEEYDE